MWEEGQVVEYGVYGHHLPVQGGYGQGVAPDVRANIYHTHKKRVLSQNMDVLDRETKNYL